VVGTIHLLFFVRLWIAKRAASQQRAADLDRFRRIKEAGGAGVAGKAGA
jgi:hypothetical protein